MKTRSLSLLTAILVVCVVFISPVAAAPLNDDQVLSQHIKEADGTSGQNTDSGSGIKTGHIQDGAVTDAKIAGPISADKIAGGFFQQKYGKVAVVAQSGGDYTNPLTAMNDIATWCGTPSATNPCLLKIMPGVYNIGVNGLQMQQYVDIEGSGENTTKITSTIAAATISATVSNTELRSLTIENISGSIGAGGLAVTNGAAPLISNVTFNCPSGYFCIKNIANSSLELTHVTIIQPDQAGVYGVYANTGVVTIKDSKMLRVTSNPNTTIYIANTEIGAAVENYGGIIKCVSAYYSSFAPLVCP